MPNLTYLMARLVRHFMPESLARFLLHRNIIIKPGLETRNPNEAAQRYLDVLASRHLELRNLRVMIFGYGGGFGVACHLLRAGVSHVILCEKDGQPNDRQNAALLSQFGEYLEADGARVRPRERYITLLHGDIRKTSQLESSPAIDLVLSSSVYEHLGDVEGITQALARLTAPQGTALHFIDLRDHFFKYPFEMLCYSQAVWRAWLNPTSNHNRYRLPDYQRVFAASYQQVEINVQGREEEAFLQTRSRIRPEFLSGDPAVDSVTLISAWVSRPKKSP